jgi:hypothetical protein
VQRRADELVLEPLAVLADAHAGGGRGEFEALDSESYRAKYNAWPIYPCFHMAQAVSAMKAGIEKAADDVAGRQRLADPLERGFGERHHEGRALEQLAVRAMNTLKPGVKVSAELFPRFGATDFSTEITRVLALLADPLERGFGERHHEGRALEQLAVRGLADQRVETTPGAAIPGTSSAPR